jgi:uncharacterized protein
MFERDFAMRNMAATPSGSRRGLRFCSGGYRLGLAIGLLTTLLGCRKLPPDENVFTGARAEPSVPGPALVPNDDTPASPGDDAGVGATPGRGPSPPSGGASAAEGSAGRGAGETPDDVDPELPGSAGAGAGEPPPFSKRSLLVALGDCAVQHYAEFAALAEELAERTRASAENPSAETLEMVRAAWSTAMASWQRAELYRFGPAARSTEPGGRDLRDQIYSWPLASRCRVEEQLVARADEAADFASSLVNGRSLAALEYLAFYQGTDNACSTFSVINAAGSWSALNSQALSQRKAAYAARVAGDVLERAGMLLAAWRPEGDDFAAELSSAGVGSVTFASEQAALNAASDALFYIEREVKDLKLGAPLGLVPECPNASCPEAVESPFAKASTGHLRQNLLGFQRLFSGCGAGFSGLGFDDWLVAVGASDLAARMAEAVTRARAVLDGLEVSIDQALLSEPARVASIHAAIKGITDLLKTEFITVLNLDLPRTLEGDTD